MELAEQKGSGIMKMSIHGKQLVVTDAIRKYAESKLGRVEKYHDSIIELDVSLSAVKTKTGSNHTAEVLAYLSGSTLKATCSDVDLYAAIDQVSDIIEGQLKKHKEKRNASYGQATGVRKIKYNPETNTVEKEAAVGNQCTSFAHLSVIMVPQTSERWYIKSKHMCQGGKRLKLKTF